MNSITKKGIFVGAIFCIFFFSYTLRASAIECECSYEITISQCAGGTIASPDLTGGAFLYTETVSVDGSKTKAVLHNSLDAYGVTSCNLAGQSTRGQAYQSVLDTTWKDNTNPIDQSNCVDSVSFTDTGILVSASCELKGQPTGTTPTGTTPAGTGTEPEITIENNYEGIPFALPSVNNLRVGNARTVPQLIGQMVRFVTGLFGSIALVMIIYGGIQIMLAGGQGDKVRQGAKVIAWASIGLVTMMLSYVLVSFVLGVF